MEKTDFIKDSYQECWSCMLERHPEECEKYREKHELSLHLMEGLTMGDVKIGCGILK